MKRSVGIAVLWILLGAAFGARGTVWGQQRRDGFEDDRRQMVEEYLVTAGVKHPRVLESARNTPRHEFVPPAQRKLAYFDMALPIGDRQTISSPFIVAYMTESLDPQPTDKVLEIGTGSGYQAAILSPLVAEVYSIEIVPSLGRTAKRTLTRLRYKNVHTKIGDGFLGWPEHAPFHKIIVTCSPEKVPQPLVDQLAEGGLMVIPVGERYQQTLYLMRKNGGKLEGEKLRPTLFVPMTGAAEDKRQVKPDPANPAAVNGGFEEVVEGNDQVSPGWYYQRQMQVISADDAPQGKRYVQFSNKEPGRPSHLLQGLAIDGTKIKSLAVSCRVKTDEVRDPVFTNEYCTLAVTFYDSERRDLGTRVLDAFRGTEPWRIVEAELRVPPQTREAILRIGLFGATGVACFDDVRLKPRKVEE